ncbi:hypothetical protein METBIDRAFT_63364 [Metschnikowia bicuspidata var. bicuspidata NRRL YB-4993]|uniref:U1 small nuclear ribonucleoprotein component SNU71 n=1 Tax=Metschnikowia bicuspidata var. bicuspidata NRRL YB-4993 TaxID=869754 RepID=A0A1A0HGK5_9ASCO|nr:hypothetical protein METBIDRAFT_63364 [Metschnikowia bicuspidata var. bicuspidata NRRL YB-4993]OBA23125.1 hypothetical protein METBIDRAFT_63364 [Metschnikowia bicuspidata var. bicuspidata NRRL YB-4993]
MSELKLVAPFIASGNNHQRVLACLRQAPAPAAAPPRVFRVPVRLDLDVLDIIGHNARRMPEHGASNPSGKSGGIEDAAGGPSVAEAGPQDGAQPPAFVDLGAFQPRNRLEQICTVFLQDFPALRPQHVDKVLGVLVQACPAECAAGVRFSALAETSDDTRGVFVRFPNVQMARWAHALLATVLPGVTAVFDDQLGSLGPPPAPQAAGAISLGAAAATIAAMFADRRLYSSGSGRSGTEDLDEAMQYYRTYKVEHSELVEVPKELKAAIVRDIIRFRAKVLTIERDARKREIERERREARRRLTRIFEAIRSSASLEKGGPLDAALDAGLETTGPLDALEKGDTRGIADTPGTPRPLDLLDDAEYDAHVAAQEESRQKTLYDAQYQRLRALEDSEQALLVERLLNARAYEQTLIENKLAYMDDYKTLQDQDEASATMAGWASAESGLLRLHSTNHGEYLRLRNHKRAREEAMDDEDRLDEQKSRASAGAVGYLRLRNHKRAREEAMDDEDRLDEQKSRASAGAVGVALPPSGLASLKEKIASLVEEYLGIREDLLIDFIYEFVLDNNLARGDELVTELQETLDEDSRTVVDQLHEYIAGIQ